MKRKVYIVKGYSKTPDEQASGRYYVEAYEQFFERNAGGAYTKNEITVLSEVTSSELEKEVKEEEIDFGILVFIGHGANQENNQLFQLNKDEIIRAGQYTLNSPKQIVIIESCRTISKDIYTIDLKDHVPKFKYGGVVRKPLKRETARDVYDCHILRCKDGLMICYACEKGQDAYNYFFSMMLLQISMEWYLETRIHCAILPIDELMGRTLFNTMYFSKEKIDIEQKPDYVRGLNYPFAVSRF